MVMEDRGKCMFFATGGTLVWGLRAAFFSRCAQNWRENRGVEISVKCYVVFLPKTEAKDPADSYIFNNSELHFAMRILSDVEPPFRKVRLSRPSYLLRKVQEGNRQRFSVLSLRSMSTSTPPYLYWYWYLAKHNTQRMRGKIFFISWLMIMTGRVKNNRE